MGIMTTELWLEFGFIQRDQNNWHEMLWYNEGRWQELPYFIKNLTKRFFSKNMYFKARYGKRTVFLRET